MSSGPEQLCGPPASSERLPGEADSCPPPGRSPRLPASGMPMQDKNRRAAGSGRAESHSGGPHHRFSYTLPDRPKGWAPLQILEAHAAASAQFPGGRPTHVPPRAVACQPRCCLLGHGASGASLVLVGRLTHGLVCGSGRRRGSGTWGLQTPHAGHPSGPSLDTRKWRLCRAKDPGDTGKEFLDCGAVTGRGEG